MFQVHRPLQESWEADDLPLYGPSSTPDRSGIQSKHLAYQTRNLDGRDKGILEIAAKVHGLPFHPTLMPHVKLHFLHQRITCCPLSVSYCWDCLERRQFSHEINRQLFKILASIAVIVSLRIGLEAMEYRIDRMCSG